MGDIHPQTIVAYDVYYGEGAESRLIGVVDAELPNIQTMTQEMKGAGLAGTIDVPVVGQVQPLSCKLTWRTATDDVALLISPKPHKLTLYAVVQSLKSDDVAFELTQQMIEMLVIPKNINIGKFATAEVQGLETEFSVYTLDWKFGNTTMCKINILSGVYQVGDINFYQKVLDKLQRT